MKTAFINERMILNVSHKNDFIFFTVRHILNPYEYYIKKYSMKDILYHWKEFLKHKYKLEEIYEFFCEQIFEPIRKKEYTSLEILKDITLKIWGISENISDSLKKNVNFNFLTNTISLDAKLVKTFEVNIQLDKIKSVFDIEYLINSSKFLVILDFYIEKYEIFLKYLKKNSGNTKTTDICKSILNENKDHNFLSAKSNDANHNQETIYVQDIMNINFYESSTKKIKIDSDENIENKTTNSIDGIDELKTGSDLIKEYCLQNMLLLDTKNKKLNDLSSQIYINLI